MADDEDLYKGPLAERVQSKNWKVRRAAFEELQQKFKEATDNAIFDEYAPKFKKIIEDKNAAAQEKGLEALLTWIDRAENPTKLNGLCQALAVNCFGGRSNTVQKAIEALLLFIEVDRSGEAVIAALLPECFSKQWKISSTAISTIALALKTFGHKHVPLKPILKEVAKMFEDSNAKVREEAQKLMIEMYRWAGAALKPTVDTLRPAQAKDLNTAFEALPQAKAVPEKRLRCEQPQDDEEEAPAGRGAGGGGGGGEDEEEEAGGMDAYELAEPVDILSKLPGDWYDKVASTKWKERNEQMDVLLSLLNTPRLQPGDYRELTKTIKKIIDKDANVTVVMKAAQAAGLLAKGLRQAYSADAKYLVSTLLAKFKEKKANVVTAIHEALDAMMDTCFALTDLAEDLPAAADAKTPPGREQTLAFVLRFIAKSKRASVGQAIKLLGPLLLKAMDDSTPEVREAAYKAFGALVGKVGERPLSPYLTKLDGIKEKKAKENYPEKIFTGTLNLNPQAAAAKPAAAANGKPAPAAKKPAAAAAVNGKPAAATANGKPATASATASGVKRPAATAAASSGKPPGSSQPPKPTAAAAAPKPELAVAAAAPPKPAAAAAPKPVVAKPRPKPQPVIPVELPLITPEEAMEKATAVLAETTLPLLEDAQWKNRVAGMEELTAQLDKLLEKDDALMVQVILRLVEQKPGFKDANFQVMQKVLHTITRLAKSQFFTKPMAELVLAVLVDKIADIKLRLVALECLNGVVEAVGLDFVLREVYKHATESKNPKAANEVLSWITTAIEDFGIQGPPAPVDVKLLVEFVKTLLEHSNAMVRSSATKTVTKIFTFVGEAIKEHLGDVKPALMTTIEKEFTKYANAKPDPPTKFYRQKEAVVPLIEEAEEPEPESVAEEPAAAELEPAPASVGTKAAPRPAAAAAAAAPALADDGWVEGSIDHYDDDGEESAPPARADITPLLTPALFAELADPKDWKRRKEALDKIRRILSEANMSVQSGCLALLMPKLNARLKDTNKNLVLYTVKLLGLLATAVGREIEGQMKLTVPLVLANYTDQKQTMRDTVAKTLDQWAAEVGADAFVPFFPPAVAIESSSARKDALAWLVAHKQDLGKKSDVRVLLRPAVAALQDKTKEVRDLAEELLMHLFARVDVESIRAVCKELPQAAVRQQVVGLAKKARGSVSASGSSVGSTTSSNDGSEKSVASSASSRSVGSVAPGSVKPPRSSNSSTAKVGAEKPAAPSTTITSSSTVSTRRPSTTTAPSGLSRESKPQPTRGEATTPLVANEDKAKRQRQDKDHITDDQGRGGWSFKTAPRPEHAQHLQQQARPYVGEALHAKMFSRDFRKHREALQELTAAVDDYPAATQQNADLLLKWASLRLFDANTSTQAKTLAFVEHLFRALDARDHQLTDYEAGVILPALLECLGQGEAMQEGIGALLKLVPRVYPSSKFFTFLLHTGLLGSKSPRTRAECLEQMAGLVRRHGLAAVCPSPSAAFPQITPFVTDKVSAVRNAALALIQQAHLHAGDDLWLYTGSLNDTQRALINQKLGGGSGSGSGSGGSASPLRSSSSGVVQPSAVRKVKQHAEEEKRSSRSSSPSATAHKAKAAAATSSSSSVGSLGSSKTVVGVRTTTTSSRAVASRSSRPASDDGSTSQGPSSAAPSPPPPLQSFSLELDKLQPVVKSTRASRPVAALEPTTSAAAAAEPTSTAGSSVVIETWVKELASGDVDKMIGVCKAVLERLAEGVAPFVGCSDGLVQALAGLLNSTLRQKDFSIDRNREFKYFVNVLFKLFSQAPLAIGISRDASKCVLHSLMVAFVDPLVVPRSDTDTANNLYKGIQLATMKVLRNTDQTAIFTTLLEMLGDVLLSGGGGGGGGGGVGGGGELLPKGFAEVLIKALAIAVQHIKETIDELNLDQVLHDLNAFLEAHHGRAPAAGGSNDGDDGDGSIKAQMRQECVRLCHAAVKEIVAIKGRAGVSRHLSLVPVTKYPTPALVRVINKVLRDTFGAAGEAHAPEDARPEAEAEAGETRETREEDAEDGHLAAKIELRQIMQRLASSERQQAIKDMYHFKCRHPEIDIQPYLATATTQFQTYVRRALMAVEEKENMPVRPDPANASAAPAPAPSAGGSEDVYVDKLRALQKRYGRTTGNNKHGAPGASSNALLSLASSTDSTASATATASASAASAQLPAKPSLPSPANGASIQDLRLRLNTVLRTAGVAPATPTHHPHQAPAADVSTPSPSASSSDLSSAPSYAAMTPTSAAASAASVAISPAPSGTTLDVQALKERLARIKQTAAK